jgi:tetratricopeptide (TPR) repeat protein
MSKLISEADKLLEKGKVPEAIEKLKSALKAEPLNQLVATKIANVFVEEGEPANAAKVYIALATRLSDAGKAQVAIAIYKQALELTPNDIDLKVKFAIECEAVGKVGDAQTQANLALQYYLRRKKYFDATNILPLLARVQTKDEKIKIAWVEIMQLSQAEQKLVHLLVAVCGPPGMVSQEFPKGGDPATISEGLYESLKKLVPFFPRDPKIAYAVAWAAHRRGRDGEFFQFLRECLRREPDYCLALLLLARVFAEKQKLNESLFIYKYFKERLTSDKSADMLTLSRLLESFVEKNGWVTFTEGMGVEDLDAAGFLAAVSGKPPLDSPAAKAAVTPPAPGAVPPLPRGLAAPSPLVETVIATSQKAPAVPAEIPLDDNSGPPPAEIELSLGGEEEGMELQLSNSSFRAKSSTPASPAPAPEIAPAVAPAVAPAPAPAAAPSVAEPPAGNSDSVEFTSIIKTGLEEPPEQASTTPTAAKPPLEEDPAVAKPKITFNPLGQSGVNAADANGNSLPEREERTQMYSPMEILGATNIVQQEIGKVETKKIIVDPAGVAAAGNAAPGEDANVPPSYTNQVRAMEAEGEATRLFSPVESVQAGKESRRPHVAQEPMATKVMDPGALNLAEPQTPLSPPAPVLSTPPLAPPAPSPVPPNAANPPPEEFSSLDALANAEGEATLILTLPVGGVAPEPVAAKEPDPFAGKWEQPAEPAGNAFSEEEIGTMVFRPDRSDVSVDHSTPDAANDQFVSASAPAVSFVPMPSFEIPAAPPPPVAPAITPAPLSFAPNTTSPEAVDMGDDLLDGPTRELLLPDNDATAHLFQEIKQDIAEKKVESADNHEYMLKKAERYIAKRNYYLARKALRHSLALGADELKVKERLRDIRKLEMPGSLYSAISSDESTQEGSSEILDRLEEEFELRVEETDADHITASLENQLEEIFRDSDARTILDFGVGLHEMGMYRQAEAVFTRLVMEFPESAFDAYYLAAVSKFSRKDYAGAASILKKLSGDSGKSELQKIPIYYALGELFEKMQRPERSKEFFKKVAELDSNYRNIRHKLEE